MSNAFLVFGVLAVVIGGGLLLALAWTPRRRSGQRFEGTSPLNRLQVVQQPADRVSSGEALPQLTLRLAPGEPPEAL